MKKRTKIREFFKVSSVIFNIEAPDTRKIRSCPVVAKCPIPKIQPNNIIGEACLYATSGN